MARKDGQPRIKTSILVNCSSSYLSVVIQVFSQLYSATTLRVRRCHEKIFAWIFSSAFRDRADGSVQICATTRGERLHLPLFLKKIRYGFEGKIQRIVMNGSDFVFAGRIPRELLSEVIQESPDICAVFLTSRRSGTNWRICGKKTSVWSFQRNMFLRYILVN